ncbi:hypothetical protein AAG906_017218 [Vitis piasezkii]
MIQHDRYRPVAPIRPAGTTYLHPPPQPVYATQAPQRPPMQFHHQYRAPPPPRSVRQPPLQPTLPGFRIDLHCAYHQRAGHDTIQRPKHAIQDLIDQGLVDLGRPGVATDPLPTHDTRAVPPPLEGVHLIEFAGDEIFMMGWDGEAPQPISLYEKSDFVGYIPRQQIPRPFSLTPDKIYGPPPISPVYLQHVPPMTPFILFPEEYRPPHRDVQIVTRSGRVAQPPPIDVPFLGIAPKRKFERKMMRYYASALLKLAYLFGAFWPHLAIGVACSRTMVLPECHPLVTAIALGFSPADFRASTQTAGAIPSSLHQKVKFIHEGRIIMIQSDRDIITSFEPVLHISHSENDLHLTGFTFDEVQVVSLENGSRDMTLVLSMMRGMSYLPGMGLGRRQQGPHEFTFAVDHDTPYGLAQVDAFGHRTRDAGAMIVAPPSPDRASVFSMCFPEEVPDYDLPMDLGDGTDEMDMIGIGRIFDAAPRGPHIAFDMFGVSILETDEDDSIPDAYTDDMDFIGIGRILDVAPREPHSAFDIFGVFVLDDESVLDVVTSILSLRERPTVDPPLSSHTMSGFYFRVHDRVTRFSLIAPPAPTTHIYDVDDVGDTDDPLGGHQSGTRKSHPFLHHRPFYHMLGPLSGY